MKPQFLLGAGLLLLAVASLAWGRVWTDRQGRTMEGQFVRFHSGNVVLLRGGKTITVPFVLLSAEDQDYVREQLEAKGQGNLLPPAPAKDAVPAARPEAERVWTDLQGKQIRAEFVEMSGENVVFLFNGQRVPVPFSRLSPADHQFLRGELESKGQGHLLPRAQNAPLAQNPPPWPALPPGPAGPSRPGMPPRTAYPPRPQPGPAVASRPMVRPPPSVSPPPPPPRKPPAQTVTAPLYREIVVKKCSACNRDLPDSARVGQKCPHCGAYFSYEKGADGKTQEVANAKTGASGEFPWKSVGMTLPLGGLVLGLLWRYLRR